MAAGTRYPDLNSAGLPQYPTNAYHITPVDMPHRRVETLCTPIQDRSLPTMKGIKDPAEVPFPHLTCLMELKVCGVKSLPPRPEKDSRTPFSSILSVV